MAKKRKAAPDPISLMRKALRKQEPQSPTTAAEFAAFRRTHDVNDAQCRVMIVALKDGRATSIEEAFRVAGGKAPARRR